MHNGVAAHQKCTIDVDDRPAVVRPWLTSVLQLSKTGRMAKRPCVLTLSAKESLILDLLTEHDELYGLQLVAESKRKLKRGTVYVTLGRMEEKGYIASRL